MLESKAFGGPPGGTHAVGRTARPPSGPLQGRGETPRRRNRSALWDPRHRKTPLSRLPQII